MTELNVSGNAATWDGNKHGEMSGVIALADAIPDMRALEILDISDNSIREPSAKLFYKRGSLFCDSAYRALGKALAESEVQFLICDEWCITEETRTFDVATTRSSGDLMAMLAALAQNNRTSLVLTGLERRLFAASCKSGCLMYGCWFLWFSALVLTVGIVRRPLYHPREVFGLDGVYDVYPGTSFLIFFMALLFAVSLHHVSLHVLLPRLIDNVRVCYYVARLVSMRCAQPSKYYRGVNSDAELDELEISVRQRTAARAEMGPRAVAVATVVSIGVAAAFAATAAIHWFGVVAFFIVSSNSSTCDLNKEEVVYQPEAFTNIIVGFNEEVINKELECDRFMVGLVPIALVHGFIWMYLLDCRAKDMEDALVRGWFNCLVICVISFMIFQLLGPTSSFIAAAPFLLGGVVVRVAYPHLADIFISQGDRMASALMCGAALLLWLVACWFSLEDCSNGSTIRKELEQDIASACAHLALRKTPSHPNYKNLALAKGCGSSLRMYCYAWAELEFQFVRACVLSVFFVGMRNKMKLFVHFYVGVIFFFCLRVWFEASEASDGVAVAVVLVLCVLPAAFSPLG
jgi:hypothetical protein